MSKVVNDKSGPDLSVDLGGIKMANPVTTASGTCGYALEMQDFVDLSGIGAFITKSITLEPRTGNPPQRTVETPSGMLNAIGLANVGLGAFCDEKIPQLETLPIPVIVNVAGKTLDEYIEVAGRVNAFDVVGGLELNISCPNVKEGGITFGTDPESVFELVSAIRKVADKPLIVKLTPNVTDITIVAKAAVEAGCDAISMINTLIGMAIDIEKRSCIIANRTGGLSGPAIKPVAINLVNRVYNTVTKDAGIPILGLGGIANAADAIEFIIAGASAVSVGTMAMVSPRILTDVVDGIRDYLIRHNISSVKELTGSLG